MDARAWWEGTLNGERAVGLTLVTMLGFLRLITNPRFTPNPMTVRAATETVREWMGTPNVTVLHPGVRHYDLLFELIESVGVAGNLTTDAHLAALAIEWQAEVATCDVDFSRFPRVRWYNPLKR